MNYYQVSFVLNDVSQSEILIALLAEHGFESFIENENGIDAFINEPQYNIMNPDVIEQANQLLSFTYTSEFIKDKNWNEEWERNYEMVVVDGLCTIRAPFHLPLSGIKYDLLIEPKMSFGTAHHETTYQMIQYILETEFIDKSVLDMGCGTCVLAILAAKKGAKHIVAVDNDEWAYNNSLENIYLNNTPEINVLMGDSNIQDLGVFDVIIANINRNVLLNDIPNYAAHINPKGTLLLSGFYINDLPAIKEKASENGFSFQDVKEKNKWVAARFFKM